MGKSRIRSKEIYAIFPYGKLFSVVRIQEKIILFISEIKKYLLLVTDKKTTLEMRRLAERFAIKPSNRTIVFDKAMLQNFVCFQWPDADQLIPCIIVLIWQGNA